MRSTMEMTLLVIKVVMNRKDHWEKVYNSKQLDEVGWFHEKPVTSLKFIKKINPPKDVK